MEKILTSREIFALEEKAVKSGQSIDMLMERAGNAVFEEVVQHYKPCKTLVLCGPGNNGGDGFVVARLLKDQGWKVDIALDKSANPNLSQATQLNKSRWQSKIIDFREINLDEYDLIIDALFGIGLHREVSGIYKDVITSINKGNKKVVATDIPSGIDSDTGQILGCAIKAKLTVTFEYKKPAHIMTKLDEYCGTVIVKNIGIS